MDQYQHLVWIKPYIDMNTEVRNNTKENFEKRIFQVDEQRSFWKTHGKSETTQRYRTCNN